MKSAFRTTLLMAIVAIGATAVAAYYFPKSTVENSSEMIGEMLFEDYDPGKVSWIEITRYDRDSNEEESIRIRKRNDKWIIPDKSNFEINSGQRISEAIVCLNQLMVNDVKEDTQRAHIDYGVVDPTEEVTATNRSGLGVKISLEDRSKQTIADLIVGDQVQGTVDDPQYYVRIPGQAAIYVIDFNKLILEPEFGTWVSSNIFQISYPAGAPGQQIAEVSVDNYRLNPETMGQPQPRDVRYQASFSNLTTEPRLNILVPFGEQQDLEEIVPTNEQGQAMFGWASRMGQNGPPLIANVMLSDVMAKETELIRVLRIPDEAAPDGPFQSMHQFGFRKSGYGNINYGFESVRGAMTLNSPDGITTNIYFGAPAGSTVGAGGRPGRFMMIAADINPSAFPEPEKPENPPEDPRDPVNLAYLQAVEDRDRKIEVATQKARDITRTHAGWYYVLDEQIIDILVPDIEFSEDQTVAAVQAAQAAENEDEQTPAPAPEVEQAPNDDSDSSDAGGDSSAGTTPEDEAGDDSEEASEDEDAGDEG
ncbi:MAG: DUF4340 domain-containing protein [Planctomycetota bacterium]